MLNLYKILVMKKNAITPNDVNMVNSWLHNPWPGLSPYKDPSEYKDGVRYKFCGRSAETYDLLQMIETRNVVTLYGSTGVGKTSLLRAGVFPLLKQHVDVSRKDHAKAKFCPVYIRLGAPKQLENLSKEDYESMSLSELLTLCLEKVLEVRVTGSIGSTDGKRWLWYYFHSRSFYSDGHQVTPVIVLDQFEELFARKENDNRIKEFLKQLYVLADNRVLWSGEEGLHEAAFRFVITLREDRFFYLEDCIDALRLNLFKENRYRLRPLEDGPAQQIVTIPGRGIIDEGQEDEIASLIINKARNKERGDINTLMLSLICSELYERKGKLTLEAAQDIQITLESYYQDAINGLSYDEVHFIEKSFVNGENRQPVEEDKFKENAPVAYNRFYKNEDSPYKIITDIVVPGKPGHHVELVHDQLAAVINARQKAKNRWWRTFFLRIGIFAIVALACVMLLFLGQETRNKRQHPLSLMRMEAHEFSTKDSMWIDQRQLKNNAMVEQLTIEDKTEYEIDQCPYLHTIDLSMLGRDTLVLTLRDCDMLKKLILPAKIQSLWLKVSNCPKLGLSVNKGVGVLHIDPMEELMAVSVEPGVKRYVESDGIVWDLYDRRIVYYPLAESNDIKGQTFTCSFPPAIKTDKLTYGSVSLRNLEYEEVSDGESCSTSGIYLNSRSQTDIDNWARRERKDTVGYYILPDTLDHLPNGMFKFILPLDSVVMPRHLRTIRSEVFFCCVKLRQIIFPQGLDSIGDKSFYGCKSLKKLVIPATVSFVGKQAFEGCTSLESIEFLGNSVTLGDRAFANCSALKTVKLPNVVHFKASSAYKSPFCNSGAFDGKEKYTVEQIDAVEQEAGYEIAWNDSGESVIRLYEDVSEIYLPAGYVPDKYSIEPDVAFLNHIHVPWPQPLYITNGKRFELSFNLNKSDMQHITLHVPYGCKRYYEMDASFAGFRNIVEDPHYQQTKYWLSELFRISKKSTVKPQSLFFIVLLAILLIVTSVFTQRKWWKIMGFATKPGWGKIIGLSVALYLLTMLFYVILFWYFKLNWLISDPVSGPMAAIVALLFAFIVFLAPQFISSMEKCSIAGLGLFIKGCKLRNLTFLNRLKRKKIVAFGLLGIIVIGCFFAYFEQQSKDISETLANGKYKEALNLYVDSLVQSDNMNTADCLRLRQLLALAGDSAQLTLIGKDRYDVCDPNYTASENVFPSISYTRGDSVFMFNNMNSTVWTRQDVFGRGDKGCYDDKEFTVTYYDEASDSSALVFLQGDVGTLKMAGKIYGQNISQGFVFTKKKDGHKLLYDYQGRFIPYDEDLPVVQGSNTGLDIRKKEHDGVCYVFIHTDNGPQCMLLPNGGDVEFINGRFLIWRLQNGKKLAYDVQNPNNAPVPEDEEGYYNVITGNRLKVSKSSSDVERRYMKGKIQIQNTRTGASFFLPERYTNIPGTISYGLANNRYYYQSDYQYGEVGVFDFRQGGRMIADLEGTRCSFLKYPEDAFCVINGAWLNGYVISDGRVFHTYKVKNSLQKDMYMDKYYHFFGNYLIFDEDCQRETEHYARRVCSLKIPGAKRIPIVNQHLFACGDSLIVVNPSEKCFYFYRYETLEEQLERSKIISRLKRQSLIDRIKTINL